MCFSAQIYGRKNAGLNEELKGEVLRQLKSTADGLSIYIASSSNT